MAVVWTDPLLLPKQEAALTVPEMSKGAGWLITKLRVSVQLLASVTVMV